MKPNALSAALVLIPALVLAQPSWQPSAQKRVTLDLLHEVMTPDFPTTTTLGRGDFHFEISHRFQPPMKNGYDANYGLDGPANMRIALGYGVNDRTIVTLGRTNVMDNVDLHVLYRWLELPRRACPGALAVRLGGAMNTQRESYTHNGALVERGRWSKDNLQAYAQLVANVLLLDGHLGVGVVPSYVLNSSTFTAKRQYTLTLGNYYHYYLNPMLGLWLEYNPAIAGYQGSIGNGATARSHDSLAFGVCIESGGHFFYVFTTNNTRLNPSQYLVGADADAGPDNWRLAFGITRHL